MFFYSELTFFNYMKSEFKQNCVHDSDEERYTERRNKVIAFFTIPKEVSIPGICYSYMLLKFFI